MSPLEYLRAIIQNLPLDVINNELDKMTQTDITDTGHRIDVNYTQMVLEVDLHINKVTT